MSALAAGSIGKLSTFTDENNRVLFLLKNNSSNWLPHIFKFTQITVFGRAVSVTMTVGVKLKCVWEWNALSAKFKRKHHGCCVQGSCLIFHEYSNLLMIQHQQKRTVLRMFFLLMNILERKGHVHTRSIKDNLNGWSYNVSQVNFEPSQVRVNLNFFPLSKITS